MRRALARLGIAAALAAAAAPALAQGLFDDNEARRRVELLRQQIEANQRSLDERLTKIESAATDRGALLELSNQLQAMRDDLARMRGQVEVLSNQMETADKRQKDLYLDIDTRLRFTGGFQLAQGIVALPLHRVAFLVHTRHLLLGLE